jgi:hypothetical protein
MQQRSDQAKMPNGLKNRMVSSGAQNEATHCKTVFIPQRNIMEAIKNELAITLTWI